MNCMPQQGARNSHDKQSPQLNVITSMRKLNHINWKVHSKKEGVNTSTHNPPARQHTSDHYWQPPSVLFVPQGPSSTVAQSQTEQQKELLAIRGDQLHTAGLHPSHVGHCHFSKEDIQTGFDKTLDNWEYLQYKTEWREGGGFMKTISVWKGGHQISEETKDRTDGGKEQTSGLKRKV